LRERERAGGREGAYYKKQFEVQLSPVAYRISLLFLYELPEGELFLPYFVMDVMIN
jgi:hypothetical protein